MAAHGCALLGGLRSSLVQGWTKRVFFGSAEEDWRSGAHPESFKIWIG